MSTSDTLYVDVSRYAASPIAKIRSHLKYWMEKASWHKPSLLVLDNIDKLMGTELEVCFHTPASPLDADHDIIACRLVPHSARHGALSCAIWLIRAFGGTECERGGPPCCRRVAGVVASATERVPHIPRARPSEATIEGCPQRGECHVTLSAYTRASTVGPRRFSRTW